TALELHPGPRVEHPAGAKVRAAQRLVEAAHNAHAQQRLERAHVQRDLELALADPLARGRRAAALVVVHHRLAPRANVDPVDATTQHHAVAEIERRQSGRLDALGGARVEPELEL